MTGMEDGDGLVIDDVIDRGSQLDAIEPRHGG